MKLSATQHTSTLTMNEFLTYVLGYISIGITVMLLLENYGLVWDAVKYEPSRVVITIVCWPLISLVLLFCVIAVKAIEFLVWIEKYFL